MKEFLFLTRVFVPACLNINHVHSDLWIADTNCVFGCDSVPTFDPSTSSTFSNQSTPFQITYGSGQAVGVLGQDIVQLAGFSVSDQTFGERDTCNLCQFLVNVSY